MAPVQKIRFNYNTAILGAHGNSTGPDALFSQGSVKVANQSVFAVNVSTTTNQMMALYSELFSFCRLALVPLPCLP